MLGPGLKKEKPLSSEFAFSLAAAFFGAESAGLRGSFEAVPVATSRTTEASGAAPGPWTEVSWDAWSENYRDLGKDRAGMQCTKFQYQAQDSICLALCSRVDTRGDMTRRR